MVEASPEFELVRACAVVGPDVDEMIRISERARHDLDWDAVVEHAMAHAVLPLLHQNLSRACPVDVPGHWQAALGEHFAANAEMNATLATELDAILEALSESGVRALPFKGPVLATSVYGDLALREHGDLDILVAPESHPSAAAVLHRLGIEQVSDLGWQVGFSSRDGRVTVDLHRSLSEPRFPLRLRFEELWGRRHTVQLAGSPAPSFGPEDTLLVACFQLVKDGWDRRAQLSKVLDVAQTQRKWPNLDRDALFERAAMLGIERLLFIALLLAHRVVGGSAPPLDTLREADRAAVHDLAARMCDDLVLRKDLAPSPHFGQQRRFHARARERLRDKIFPYVYVPDYTRTYIKPAFEISSQDRAFVNLPRQLTFLYPIVRAYRVGSERLRGAPVVRVRAAEGVRAELQDTEVTLIDDDGNPIVTLNAVGAVVWETLSEARTIDELVEQMLPRLEPVDAQRLRLDAVAFVESLRELELVVYEPERAVPKSA